MSSVPTPSDKSLKSELEPQRVGTEGTVDSSLNEAPQKKLVFCAYCGAVSDRGMIQKCRACSDLA